MESIERKVGHGDSNFWMGGCKTGCSVFSMCAQISSIETNGRETHTGIMWVPQIRINSTGFGCCQAGRGSVHHIVLLQLYVIT
jgi:hypothetical protein